MSKYFLWILLGISAVIAGLIVYFDDDKKPPTRPKHLTYKSKPKPEKRR